MNAGTQALPEPQQHTISFCSLLAGGQLFGIDTASIREVLGKRRVERVPLAPHYIAGIVPYRGEVLTAVSLCALLRIADPAGGHVSPTLGSGCVLVIEDEAAAVDGHGHGSERFALVVDAVGGVVTVERESIARNPSTLDEIGRALFSGSVRTAEGLLVQLDPHRLNPAGLARSAVFSAGPARESQRDGQEAKETQTCAP